MRGLRHFISSLFASHYFAPTNTIVSIIQREKSCFLHPYTRVIAKKEPTLGTSPKLELREKNKLQRAKAGNIFLPDKAAKGCRESDKEGKEAITGETNAQHHRFIIYPFFSVFY